MGGDRFFYFSLYEWLDYERNVFVKWICIGKMYDILVVKYLMFLFCCLCCYSLDSI